MGAGRLSVPIATSGEASPERRLSVGALVGSDGLDADAPTDSTITLLELWAHIGDVLSFHQEQIANESYLDAHRDEGANVVQIRLGAGLRPALCLVADDHRVFLVVVGSETEASTVRFGEGIKGKALLGADEVLAATYRRDPEDAGEIELSGVKLTDPFVVLVICDPRTTGRCFYAWRSRADAGS